MIDFAPRKFLEEVDRLVVPQFGKLEDLNVFVSAVRDGDCVGGGGGGRREEGRAWWCIRTHVEEEKEEEEVAEEVKEWFPAGKRNRVCEMVREVLLGRMAVARLGEGKGGRDGEKKGGHGGKAQADVRVMECVLTTLAHQVPPRFEEALTFLREGAREGGREGGREVEKEGRGSQGQDRVNYHLKGEVASRLLRFLSFFTDMDALYRVALGMYDVTLARAIARLSPKMDPREYLPFLEDAEKLMGKEEGGEGKGWKGKVTIDLFLSRPLRALEVMAWEGGGEGEDGGEVEEEVVVDLVQTHGFEEAAVPLFVQERFPSLHGRLLGLWAARLMAEKAYGKALVVWVARAGKKKGGRKGGREGPGEGGRERRESLLKAAECARLSEDWRMALLLVGEVEKEEGREGGRTGSSSLVEHWARQMVGNLVGGVGGGREEKVRLQEGARICWEYLRDVEGAVDALTRAGEWREAMRVARKGGREDLVETDICMGVKEAVVGLQSWVEGGRARWKEGRRRLEEMVGRVVREDEEKEAAEVARRGRGREGGGGEEAESVFSAQTGDSRMSSVTDASFRSGTSSHASSHSRLTWTVPGGGGSVVSSSGSNSSLVLGLLSLQGRKGDGDAGSRQQPGAVAHPFREKKKAKRKIKLTAREEEAGLRRELEGLSAGRKVWEEVEKLLEGLLLFGETKMARGLLGALQELVEECATLPLPAPPTQKPEEKGEGGRRKEEREAGEGDRERREEEGEVMAEFENFFAPYLFLS
jgi:hypothetical protein